MKYRSTLILKIVLVLVALVVLAICLFILPIGIMTDKSGYYRPILLGMYIPAIPFFVALLQSMKLLQYIDRNKIFSYESVQSLKYIKYSAIAICGLYIVGLPYIFYAANLDDAPGVVLIGLIFIFGSLVVATASSVFQHLLQNVVNIKSENELTV